VLAVNLAADPHLRAWQERGARLRVQDERASALAAAARQLPGALLRAAVAPATPFPPDADVALINLHHLWGRQVLRDSIAAALAGLRPGGRLLLAGANRRGVRSAADDLAAASGGPVAVLAYRKGHRLLAAVRPEAWQPPQPPAPALVATDGLVLRRTPGVFAAGLPDAGTRLLIANLPVPPPGSDVLDLGCGGGAVAIALARRQAACRVWACDDSLRAVRAAEANAAASGVANVRVLHGDGFAALPPGLRFELIAVNPPWHFGGTTTTAVAASWLRQAFDRLRPGGRLYVVYNRFLPFLGQLRAAFGPGQATVLAEADGYRVAGAVRPAG
jgi:16S rRNA (guanine1207-N2)-methyltransferase